MVGISRRPQARKLTPVRTTNGTTPRSSRAYQRRHGLSARPGAIADIDAPTEAAACVEIATRARHDARALVRGLPASHRLGAHPGRRHRYPTDTSPPQMRSPTTTIGPPSRVSSTLSRRHGAPTFQGQSPCHSLPAATRPGGASTAVHHRRPRSRRGHQLTRYVRRDHDTGKVFGVQGRAHLG